MSGGFAPRAGKPLIIGQAPARGNDGKLPFAGASGSRLALLAGVGGSGDELPEHFTMVNVLRKYPGSNGKGDNFDLTAARLRARRLRMKLSTVKSRHIILMGNNVARSFGIRPFKADRFKMVDKWQAGPDIYDEHAVYLFPHPSAINRYWNEREHQLAAARFLRRILALYEG
jgi:uracil-DNA glycosylase